MINTNKYRTDNILETPIRTAHSGPELCTSVPAPKAARKLASTVILGNISIVRKHQSYGGASGLPTGLRFDLR
jgi:hypothetical protein